MACPPLKTQPMASSYSSSHLFAIEIWTKIFALACRDDGTTGRSLASVSLYISSVVKSVKLQSIVLSNYPRILAFLQVMQAMPIRDRRVRFLTIQFATPLAHMRSGVEVDNSITQSLAPSTNRLQLLLRNQREKNVAESISHLLSILAPSLVDVSVDFEDIHNRTFTFLPPVEFPKLLHLKYSACSFPILSTPPPSCPRLQNLILDCTQSGDFENVAKHITTIAPSLQKVTVTVQSFSQLMQLLSHKAWEASRANDILDKIVNGALCHTEVEITLNVGKGWNQECEDLKVATKFFPNITVRGM